MNAARDKQTSWNAEHAANGTVPPEAYLNNEKTHNACAYLSLKQQRQDVGDKKEAKRPTGRH